MVYLNKAKQLEYMKKYNANKRLIDKQKLNQSQEIYNDYYMNLLMWKHKIKTPHNELIRRMYEPRHRYEMKIILRQLYENWL